jgi:ribosomal protein S27AE
LFLFIGGIQPRTIRLDKFGRICPRCGHHGLYAKRQDHYFSLFFIPLFRVKRGEPFVSCDHCRSVFDESERTIEEPAAFRRDTWKCPDCGRSLEGDFEYCPRCGKRVRRP